MGRIQQIEIVKQEKMTSMCSNMIVNKHKHEEFQNWSPVFVHSGPIEPPGAVVLIT